MPLTPLGVAERGLGIRGQPLRHSEFGGTPKKDGAKSPDKPNVARQRSERNAFSALDCQCWKAHPAEHTNKSNWQRNKKQTGDPPAQPAWSTSVPDTTVTTAPTQ